MNTNTCIIMSVYFSDSVLYFKQAIDSLLDQTYPVDIYIFVDGDISLTLRKVLETYSQCSNVFIFYNIDNIGLAKGLNKLIDEFVISSDYKYVARMDSDDISRPNRIEKQINFFEDNENIDVLGTSCREFGASFSLDEKHLPKTHRELLNFSITRCPFIHPSVMFRVSVFKKGFRYPENTILTEDMAFWFLLLRNGFHFANINEILLDYRLNEDTIHRRKGLKKAMSEINVRAHNMILLKQVNLKNIALIGARVVFHLMPSSLVKFAYKKAR